MNRPNTSHRPRRIGLRIAHHALTPLRIAERMSGRALLGLLALLILGMGVLSVAVLTADRDTATHSTAATVAAVSENPCAAPCAQGHHLAERPSGPAADPAPAPVPQFPNPGAKAATSDWPFATTTTVAAAHVDLGGSSNWHIDI